MEKRINFNKLKKPYFIAEIGGNHAGKMNLALEGIINAKKSGADCVKFQMYKAEELVTKKMPVMQHVKKTSKEKFQYDRFKKLEISEQDVCKNYKLCKKIKIDFSVTPFYKDCVRFLSKYVSFYKVASGDINFFSLIQEIAKFKKPVVVSTGMSTPKEIKEILKILKKNQVVLLHCISTYPTSEENLNLNSYHMLQKFNLPLGFSDHTKGTLGAIMSLPFGALVFEKHFLPNYKIKKVGDFKLSLNPKELKTYIETIRNSYTLLGKKRNSFFDSESSFYNSLRRSPYFKLSMRKREKISKDKIVFLRPFNKKGINNFNIEKILGKKLKKNVNFQQLIQKKLFY